MRVLGIFGHQEKDIWEQFCNEVDGRYIKGGLWTYDKVLVNIQNWSLTLDIDVRVYGRGTYSVRTRMRAPFISQDGFWFKIYHKNLFAMLGMLLRSQDILLGDPYFDDSFVLQSNNTFKARKLFSNQYLRRLIQAQPVSRFGWLDLSLITNFKLQVKDTDGLLGTPFPKHVDLLYFEGKGIITNVRRLHSLTRLFNETLNQLCLIGSAYEANPNIELE
jgi:hypothetical protein